MARRARRMPPGATRARFAGTCCRCGQPYKVGDEIGKAAPGWAHLTCRSVMDPGPRKAPSRGGSRKPVDTELHRRVTDVLGKPEPYV